MPVNSTHTTRITELESKVQELEKEHALYFASNQGDKIRLDAIESRLYEIQNPKKNTKSTNILNVVKSQAIMLAYTFFKKEN
jgi:hypothetical protein